MPQFLIVLLVFALGMVAGALIGEVLWIWWRRHRIRKGPW